MRVDYSELCRVEGSGLRELIKNKYVNLTAFYDGAPGELGVSSQTLRRFIGSEKPSQKKLARKILILLGKSEREYGKYFTDEEKKRSKAANNREVIGVMILKIEELEQKIDSLAGMISMYFRWKGDRKK
jgi:hypothetical protein